MGAVVAYAYAQLGARYVHGASGNGRYDCSGLTMRAFSRAGLRLPHQSGAQAQMASPVSRSQARAGDLVVGPGHVGIYVGHGFMIDAGNPRVGVSMRRLYGGLSIRRF
jgi:cell wall-associated NlpC family hydrolase